MRISVELVPRDEGSLEAQLAEVRCLARVDTVNAPDLAQFGVRGWEAALSVARSGRWRAVPHLRADGLAAHDAAHGEAHGAALDAALDEVVTALTSAGVGEVLVVSGDAGPVEGPEDGAPRAAGDAVRVIGALKSRHPGLKVYAALDPYRKGFADELAYVERKLAAGADGLFTQPFFDLRLLQLWQELTAGVEVFWGVTSVTSTRSQRYWLSRNRAVFPAGFEPTIAWHRDLAARVLDHVAATDANLYFMPIRVGIVDWLGDILREPG